MGEKKKFEWISINSRRTRAIKPTGKLRPYDDTGDEFIIQALSFGLFSSENELTPIIVLTGDPFDKIFARVQQYQSFIAYAQNPKGNRINATAKIKHQVYPGTLYSFDPRKPLLKMVTFSPAQILEVEEDSSIQVKQTCSKVEQIRF